MANLTDRATEKERYVRAAYRQANKRQKSIRFMPMLLQTPIGLLRLEWGRHSWEATWLLHPVKLEIEE